MANLFSWVTGEPGAGKSALVTRLISGGLVSAAHYCRQRVAESLDAETEPRQLYDKAMRATRSEDDRH